MRCDACDGASEGLKFLGGVGEILQAAGVPALTIQDAIAHALLMGLARGLAARQTGDVFSLCPEHAASLKELLARRGITVPPGTLDEAKPS